MARTTLQLFIQALLLRAESLAPHPTAGYVGRVIDLSPDGTEYDRMILIGRRELAAAEAWVRSSHAWLAALPRDEEGFVLLSEVPATRGAQCASCPMQFACAAVSAEPAAGGVAA